MLRDDNGRAHCKAYDYVRYHQHERRTRADCRNACSRSEASYDKQVDRAVCSLQNQRAQHGDCKFYQSARYRTLGKRGF